jgi:hypothetical protein
MKQFRIFAQNNMSELVKVSEAIGKKGVNIKAIVTDGSMHGQVIKLVTNDVNTTQSALNSAGLNYELKEILSVELPDRPGELYKVTRKLAKARVMVESLYILGQSNGKTEVAMVVDDMDGARTALRI